MKTEAEIREAHALHRDAVVKLGPRHPLFGELANESAEGYLSAVVVEAALEWVLELPPRTPANPIDQTLPTIRDVVSKHTRHERN